MSSSINPKVTRKTGNSISILDGIFANHGWFKEYPTTQTEHVKKLVYTSQKNMFCKFIIENQSTPTTTQYKVAMPLTDTRFSYCATLNSAFDLIDYIDTVLTLRTQTN